MQVDYLKLLFFSLGSTPKRLHKTAKNLANPLGRAIWRNQAQILLPIKSIFSDIFFSRKQGIQ